MKNLFYVSLFLLISINSCILPKETATLFVPNKPSYHLLEKQKDYRVEGGFKTFDIFDQPLLSGELQLAYSPIKHLGVIGNYSLISTEFEGFEKRKLHFGEVGLNFYLPIPRGEKQHHVFEFVTGFGIGKATDYRESTTSSNNFHLPIEDRFYAKSNRMFAQLNYGFKHRSSGRFRIAVGPSFQISRLNVYEIDHVSNFRPLMLENPIINLFSIGINLEMGTENVQFTSYLSTDETLKEKDQLFYNKYIDANDGGMINIFVGLKTRF